MNSRERDSRERRTPSADHPVAIEASARRFVVRANGRVVADSTSTLTLAEAAYPLVQYFPRADVDMSSLTASSTSTYCPYKGDASYYSIMTPDGALTDAAWSYADAFPAVAEIAGMLAFYPDRVEIEGVDREGRKRHTATR